MARSLAGHLGAASERRTASVAVVDAVIGGNAIFGGLGPAAVKRSDRYVLEQLARVTSFCFEGQRHWRAKQQQDHGDESG